MKKYARQIIAAVCLIAIILRIIFPKMVFDVISLSLLGLAIIALIIPEPEALLARAKKFKFGNFELEMDKLNETAETVEKELDKKLEQEDNKPDSIPDIKVHLPDVKPYIVGDDLEMEVVKLTVEIERVMRSIYEVSFPGKRARLTVPKLADELKEHSFLDSHTHNLLIQFWGIRNSVVHGYSHESSTAFLLSFIDVGIRVLKILKVLDEECKYGLSKMEVPVKEYNDIIASNNIN